LWCFFQQLILSPTWCLWFICIILGDYCLCNNVDALTFRCCTCFIWLIHLHALQ
jgi:hypothetical protein